MKNPMTAFIRKEFYHILRDVRTMTILLVIPVLLIFLLGFALNTDIKNVNIAYTDTTGDAMVGKIMERIGQSDYFTVVGRLYDIESIVERMKAGEIDAAIRFDKNQGLQIAVDASNPNIGATESMYLQRIIAAQLREEAGADSPAALVPTIRMLYNPRMQSSYNFIPGILGMILILVCAIMTSISIVREKETGTMEVLLTAPLKPINIIIAKMVPYFIMSCIDIALILLLARFVLLVPLSGNMWLIIMFSIMYTLMSLALGLFVSTITDNQATALILSGVVLMIPVMMLSGMMFPIESMPRFFRIVSNIVPARWYIDAMRKLMIEGLPFRYVAVNFWILTGMTAFCLTAAIKKFKSRLE